MTGLLEGLIDERYVPVVSWILIAAIALIALYVVVRLIRLLTSGTFIAGGRNRRTRLAVMDATAVDDKRRLVLVRRDDVEHLILIGGPTDVVVEQDIRMIARSARPPSEPEPGLDAGEATDEPPRPVLPPQPRGAQRDFRSLERTPSMRAPASARPAAASPAAPQQAPTAQSPASAQFPAAAQPSPAPQPPAAPASAPARSGSQSVPPRPAAPPASAVPPPSAPPVAPVAAPRPAAPSADLRREPAMELRREPSLETRREPEPRRDPPAYPPRPASPAQPPRPAMRPQPTDAALSSDLDDALLHELESSLRPTPPARQPTPDSDLEDEMAKLLGELSRDRR